MFCTFLDLGDTGFIGNSRNASCERVKERDGQSDTTDSETTDVKRINRQPAEREGTYDLNRCGKLKADVGDCYPD